MSEESVNQYMSSPPTTPDPSMWQLRLSTVEMLDQVKASLMGQSLQGYKENAETGVIEPVFIKEGEPLVSQKGLQCLMAYLRQLVGSHTVQGYFKDIEDFKEFLFWLNIDLSSDVMINLEDWGIDEEKYNFVCNQIVKTCNRFFSRSIGDKERLSYQTTMRSSEVRTAGGWNIFGGKKTGAQ